MLRKKSLSVEAPFAKNHNCRWGSVKNIRKIRGSVTDGIAVGEGWSEIGYERYPRNSRKHDKHSKRELRHANTRTFMT